MNKPLMTRPWEEIAEQYRDLESKPVHIELGRLCDQIAKSELAEGIHAWTSMSRLCIVQIETAYPYKGPVLYIAPVSDSELEFRFEDTLVESRQWVRIVPASAAWGRLIAFLDQLHWFGDHSDLTDAPSTKTA